MAKKEGLNQPLFETPHVLKQHIQYSKTALWLDCIAVTSTHVVLMFMLDAFSDPVDHHRGAKRREEIRPATTSQKAQSQNKTVGTSDWKQSTVAASGRHAQSFCGEWGNWTEQPSHVHVAKSTHMSQHWLLELLVFCLRARWSCRTSWRRSEMTPRIT